MLDRPLVILGGMRASLLAAQLPDMAEKASLALSLLRGRTCPWADAIHCSLSYIIDSQSIFKCLANKIHILFMQTLYLKHII